MGVYARHCDYNLTLKLHTVLANVFMDLVFFVSNNVSFFLAFLRDFVYLMCHSRIFLL